MESYLFSTPKKEKDSAFSSANKRGRQETRCSSSTTNTSPATTSIMEKYLSAENPLGSRGPSPAKDQFKNLFPIEQKKNIDRNVINNSTSKSSNSGLNHIFKSIQQESVYSPQINARRMFEHDKNLSKF